MKRRSRSNLAITNQSGAALVLVLLVSLAVLSLGSVGSYTARTEIVISRNDLLAQRALAIAEGGLGHARAALAADVADGFDDEVAGSGTGGGLAAIGAAQTLDGASYRFRSFDGGGYYVRALDNFDETSGSDNPAADVDKRIRVQSIGLVGGARRQVEGVVRLNQGPDCAITANDDVTISGNATVGGSKGCVHSNGDVTNISGNPEMSQGATASGSMAISGNPVMEEGQEIDNNPAGETAAYIAAHSGQPQRPIPRICPLAFGDPGAPLNLAEEVRAAGGYLLNHNCKVYRYGSSWGCVANSGCGPSGATLVDGDGTWNGWQCATLGGGDALPAAKWQFSGNTIYNQDTAFFVAGWIDLSGNPGQSTASDWRVVLIALNTIKLSGNPGLEPAFPGATNPTHALRNLLMVTGNDMQVSGNPGSTTKPGALLAHEQVKFNGNPFINGFIIAEDGNPDCTDDPAPDDDDKENVSNFDDFSGNIDIVFNGLDTAFSPSSLDLEAGTWNEVRAP